MATVTPMAQFNNKVDWIYGNSRGLRQGSGEFRHTVMTHKPTFFAVNETHLKDDAMKQFVPYEYKVLCRLDRSMHGGGLLLGGRKHLLVITTPLK